MAKKSKYSGFDEEVSGEGGTRRYLNCAGKYLVRVVEVREDQDPDDADGYVAVTIQVVDVMKGGTKTITGKNGEKTVVDSDDPVQAGDVRELYWVTTGKWGKLGRRDAKLFIMRAAGVNPTDKDAGDINGAFIAAAAMEDQPLRGEFACIEKVLGTKGKKSEFKGDPKLDTVCSTVDSEAMKKKYANVPLPDIEKRDDSDDDDDDDDEDDDENEGEF